MSGARYDVTCLLCSAEMGRVVSGRFVPPPRAGAPAAHRPGIPRCGHCGGTGLLEPIDGRSSLFERAEFVRELAAEAARRPPLSRPAAESPARRPHDRTERSRPA